MTHVTTHRLRFNDTDRLGHVNNAVFAVMIEQGRTEMLQEAGLPIGADTQSVVIVRLELDFLAEMTWPGSVTIETAITRLGNRSFQTIQRLLMNETPCGQAVTILVVMDRAAKKAVSIDPWRDALSRYLAPAIP